MVQRYCNEISISGTFLQEKLEEYNKFAEEKFGKLESEVDLYVLQNRSTEKE